MMKITRRQLPLNGQPTDGSQEQKLMQSLTASSKTDGQKLTDFLTNQRAAEIRGSLEFLNRIQGIIANKARKEFNKASKEKLAKSKIHKAKVGAKVKMSDTDALYLRRECQTKSVASLCRELKINRKTAENCIKGITYKHLDSIVKPLI